MKSMPVEEPLVWYISGILNRKSMLSIRIHSIEPFLLASMRRETVLQMVDISNSLGKKINICIELIHLN